MENCTDEPPPKKASQDLARVVMVVSTCAIVLGLIANFFIIISFCKAKKLRTVTNYFIVNLAVADIFLLLSLAIYLSFYAANISMNEELESLTKAILVSIEVFSSSASLTSLASVSIDRCLAVTVPLRYQSITTHSRAIVVVLSVWSYSMITFITSFSRLIISKEVYNRIYISCLFSFTFALPILITTWSYYRIFCAVWRQVHRVPKQATPTNRRFRMIMKEFRIAINILVTTLPTYLLWGSFWVATLREVFLDQRPNYSAVVNWLLGNTPHFAATLNPLIYIAMTRDFRLLCVRVLSCKKQHAEYSFVVDSGRQRSVSMRSCSTTQSIPLVDVVSSDFSKSFTSSEDSKYANVCLSTESSFVTSSTPEEKHEFVSA